MKILEQIKSNGWDVNKPKTTVTPKPEIMGNHCYPQDQKSNEEKKVETRKDERWRKNVSNKGIRVMH